MHLQVCVYVGVCVCECLFVCVCVSDLLFACVKNNKMCEPRASVFILFYYLFYSFFCSLFAFHCVLTM